MRVSTIDRYLPEAGTVVEWPAGTAVADPPAVPAPPSFNQRFHLATADRRDGPSTWLAVAVDLPGPLDPGALRAALTSWLRRHETLRSGFRRRGDRLERFVVPAAEVTVGESGGREFDDPVTLREHLRARLDAVCRPLGWPSYLLATIVRPGLSTLFCGFDHRDVDGYSLAVAAHELPEIYAAVRAGVPVRLPPAASFLEFCAREQAAVDLPAGAVRRWRDFLAAGGGTTPRFPLDLGARPGRALPQATGMSRLLDGAGAEAFAAACRAADGSSVTGVLAAAGLAARRLGGGPVLRLLTPLHTRTAPRWRHTVGWLTTVAPLTVDARAGRFADAVAAAGAEFRAAREHVDVPVARVLDALGDAFRRDGDDVFMLSYVDYQRLPGAEWHGPRRAWHISNVTATDDAQFWVSRTHDGLFLRSRYPATPEAERSVGAFVGALGETLAEVAHGVAAR
ncbi:Condensation domain-containing protein [Amycolatopsis arida]|uniref:Condensation domain-containing protein n=1 Tax=Amycolatopsis arida TaxID=587909 RepID=A0A1I5XVM4_9PSEU|nr:condensation domain-containing protein [Amycolatopsis arida]TDX97238.1 condensation domain-containing protein [Amycolatopsis arida]SFQ36003.1 Condensation domain-containing protein [Amycolatopsis arida]